MMRVSKRNAQKSAADSLKFRMGLHANSMDAAGGETPGPACDVDFVVVPSR